MRRKKRNQYRDISGDEQDLALERERPLVQMPIAESLHQETVDASEVEVNEAENQVPIAKKRGRKPKIVAPIDDENDIPNPLGRPPLARNNLENDNVIGVVLRRSNRNKT